MFGPGVGPQFGGFRGVRAFRPLGKGGVEEEDRSRDWFCPRCRERNFVKRTQCFRCQAPRPQGSEATPAAALESGTTWNGMVKSYNRKGFGFLMCFGAQDIPDIYYTREHLSPRLETRDIPGQHVTFEIARLPDGKLTAVNIRPIGEPVDAPAPALGGKGGAAGAAAAAAAALKSREAEDRSRDWECAHCGERNFVKRSECFKCKKPRAESLGEAVRSEAAAAAAKRSRSATPPRTLSPHAGSRAMRNIPKRSRSRDRKRKRRRRRKSSSTSSSRSRGKKSKKDARKSGKRSSNSETSRSRGSGVRKSPEPIRSESSSSDCKMEGGGAASAAVATGGDGEGDPEVTKAKSEALQELLKLRSVEPADARAKEWRALLRKWHPDKNPERVEVATAVFQFLQRGKPLLDGQ